MFYENITWQITLLISSYKPWIQWNITKKGDIVLKGVSSMTSTTLEKKPPYMKKNIKKMSPSTVHLVHGTPILSVYELPVRSNTTCFSGTDVFSLVFSIDVH